MQEAFRFPFHREQFYRISELRALQELLGNARQLDSNFSAAIRGRRVHWAKLWNEELFPILLYANWKAVSDDAEFRARSEGNAVDAEIRVQSGELIQFQITTAYAERQSSRSGGYVAALEREGVNQGIPIFLGGGIERNASGCIESSPTVLSPNSDRSAWQIGLIKAIQRKLKKGTSIGDVLLIYAERLRFDTIDEPTEGVVLPAIKTAVSGAAYLPFRKLVILDQDPMARFEFDFHSVERRKF